MHTGCTPTWKDLGYWIVGSRGAGDAGGAGQRRGDAPQASSASCYTFRPRKHVQRSTLDCSNLTGVVRCLFTSSSRCPA
jgi:hypothetical protein